MLSKSKGIGITDKIPAGSLVHVVPKRCPQEKQLYEITMNTHLFKEMSQRYASHFTHGLKPFLKLILLS